MPHLFAIDFNLDAYNFMFLLFCCQVIQGSVLLGVVQLTQLDLLRCEMLIFMTFSFGVVFPQVIKGQYCSYSFAKLHARFLIINWMTIIVPSMGCYSHVSLLKGHATNLTHQFA